VSSLALVIGRAKRMPRIMLPSVGCVAVLYFSTLSKKKGTIFEKRLRNINCVF